MLDTQALEVIETWAFFTRGFLPRPGGIDDQLERDLKLIAIVEDEYQKNEKDRRRIAEGARQSAGLIRKLANRRNHG